MDVPLVNIWVVHTSHSRRTDLPKHSSAAKSLSFEITEYCSLQHPIVSLILIWNSTVIKTESFRLLRLSGPPFGYRLGVGNGEPLCFLLNETYKTFTAFLFTTIMERKHTYTYKWYFYFLNVSFAHRKWKILPK